MNNESQSLKKRDREREREREGERERIRESKKEIQRAVLDQRENKIKGERKEARE